MELTNFDRTEAVRVTCDCKVCKANAAKIGVEFPMVAFVNPKMAAQVGKQTHGVVYMAHEPAMAKAATRLAWGPWRETEVV